MPTNAPILLRSTAITTTTIIAAWNPPEGGTAPTSYEVRLGSGGTPDDVGLTTSHVFHALTPGQTYEVGVRAISGDGPSSWTTLAMATPLTLREHYSRSIRNAAGALMKGSIIAVYQHGTTTLLADPVYTAPTGDTEYGSAWICEDGVLDFYLDLPTIVDISVTTPGSSAPKFFYQQTVGDIPDSPGGGGGGEPVTPGIPKNSDVNLTAANEFFSHFVVVNDGTDSAVWPNRLSFEYKPNAGTTVGQHLTGWFNEYGEFRVTPAKANTVPFRSFTKELSTDPDHDGAVPVMEMVYARNQRTAIWGVMADGTMYTAGNIERRVPNGPTLSTGFLILSESASVPVGTPPDTLIVRIP